MANPPNMNYCKIVGNFKAFIADNQDDDDLPDFVPMTGDGSIWPNVGMSKNTQTGFKSTYFNSPISITVDQDGDLSQGGRKYVMVLVGSENMNPSSFNYSISLNLFAQGEGSARQYGPFSFDVVPGGEIDLTDVLPVAANAGVPIIQGPQGEPGDLVPTTVGNWTGSIEFADYPRTYIGTLTGNVTAITLPSSPLASQSGTITLVAKQDAVGGRTIVWPAEVLWPEAIEPQPTPGANSITLFNLMWTGEVWLGFLGGKSFA